MSENNMEDKMLEIATLMAPIDEQITHCSNGNEQIMLACGMMQRVKEILEHHLGEEESRKILKEFVNVQHVH